jgi:prophage antirepressor-like protein
MTHIEMFSNGEFQLHVVPIGDTYEIDATGVAHGLAYRDAANLVRTLPEDCTSKRYSSMSTPDDQGTWYLTESGLYRAVGKRTTTRIKDDKVRRAVERFQSWLFDEVLPTIRRTGSYTVPVPTAEVEEFYQPHTLTWDETRALIRQRYGIPMSVNELTRTLRTAGVLKQNGTPRKDWEHLFWFTGSSWNVHPHMVAQLTKKVVDTGRELQQFRFLQAQLELEGVGSPALLESERPIPRQRNVSPRPAAREDEQIRPDDNRP